MPVAEGVAHFGERKLPREWTHHDGSLRIAREPAAGRLGITGSRRADKQNRPSHFAHFAGVSTRQGGITMDT